MEFYEYQSRIIKAEILKNDTTKCIINMNISIGKCTDNWKTYAETGKGDHKIIEELGNLLSLIAVMSSRLNCSLDELAAQSLSKTLSGHGIIEIM